MIYSFPADYRTSEEVEINDAFSNVLLDIFQDHGFRSSLFAVQAHGAAGFALIRDRSTIESAKFLNLNTLAAAMRPILLPIADPCSADRCGRPATEDTP